MLQRNQPPLSEPSQSNPPSVRYVATEVSFSPHWIADLPDDIRYPRIAARALERYGLTVTADELRAIERKIGICIGHLAAGRTYPSVLPQLRSERSLRYSVVQTWQVRVGTMRVLFVLDRATSKLITAGRR